MNVDPPFDVGADFSMNIEIGGDTFTKKPNILEELAYRDTWGKGADSFIEIKPHITKGGKGRLATVAVELTDFSVHYSQDSNAAATLKNDKSKIVAESGQIVRVSKDKNGKISREQLTNHWTDWIDYWAVDFESKREIIRVRNEDTGKTEEQWTGDYVFENEWQSFRTKKDRSLELIKCRIRMLTGTA